MSASLACCTYYHHAVYVTIVTHTGIKRDAHTRAHRHIWFVSAVNRWRFGRPDARGRWLGYIQKCRFNAFTLQLKYVRERKKERRKEVIKYTSNSSAEIVRISSNLAVAFKISGTWKMNELILDQHKVSIDLSLSFSWFAFIALPMVNVWIDDESNYHWMILIQISGIEFSIKQRNYSY